jgi:hypothetical protein
MLRSRGGLQLELPKLVDDARSTSGETGISPDVSRMGEKVLGAVSSSLTPLVRSDSALNEGRVSAERCAQLQAASQGHATARPVLLLKAIQRDGYLRHRA